MCLLVGILREMHSGFHPMCSVEKLSSFEDHLYDMLVAMIFRGLDGIEVEEEYVHFGGSQTNLARNNLFSTPIQCRQDREAH
jgi:hypothetical protein